MLCGALDISNCVFCVELVCDGDYNWGVGCLRFSEFH